MRRREFIAGISLTAAPALAMSQAFMEILTVYRGAIFRRFVPSPA